MGSSAVGAVLLLLLTAIYVTHAEELLLVQVVTRHGARTSLKRFPNEPEWDCEVFEIDGMDFAGPPAVHAPERLFRRTYIPGRNMLPGNCKFGQLTSTGVKEHVMLGAALRTLYHDHYHFLPAQYDRGQVYVRSSDNSRTRLSAYSNLLGLFPSNSTAGSTEVVDLHVIDWGTDNIPDPDLFVSSWEKCPNIMPIIHDIWKDPYLADKEARAQPVREAIAAKWGVDPKYVLWMFLHDNMHARIYHNLPLPAILTESEISTVNQMGVAEWLCPYQHAPFADKFLRLTYGSFVEELLENMERAAAGKERFKYLYFSGHDTTLAAMLSMLGYRDYPWMGFASFIVYEMWRTDSGSLEVRIHFKDSGNGILGSSLPNPRGIQSSGQFFADLFDGAGGYRNFTMSLGELGRLWDPLIPKDLKKECGVPF